MDTKTNVARVYTNTSGDAEIANASGNFDIFDSNSIEMTKTVDRESGFYLSGDPITFTITITNTSDSPVNGLFFRDVMDESVVPAFGVNYVVTTTSGNVTSYDNPITVSDINIPANSTITITISGVIA
jgi:uncharacterized repeat protein (TIGR01451 family)